MRLVYIPCRWSNKKDAEGLPIIQTATPYLSEAKAQSHYDDGWVAEKYISGLAGEILFALLIQENSFLCPKIS